MNRKEHFNAAQECLRKAALLTSGTPRDQQLGKVLAQRAQGHAQLAHLLILDPTLDAAPAKAAQP